MSISSLVDTQIQTNREVKVRSMEKVLGKQVARRLETNQRLRYARPDKHSKVR